MAWSSPGQIFWTAVLLIGIAVGTAIRLTFLPTSGLRIDLDLFARWIHGIAVTPLGQAYDLGIGFPPVMVYIWAGLTALEPAFRTIVDASDPWIRTVMKSPAALADLGLALGVWVGLRNRPAVATLSALAVFLHPVVFGISSGWGQLESLYILPVLIGLLLAVRGHATSSAVFVGIALMTKPQALPLVVPFLAWYLASGGVRGMSRWVALVGLTSLVLWIPFVLDNGPAQYLSNVAAKQNGEFAVLSLDAWNPWWLIQEATGGGAMVSDQVGIIGPITPRLISLGITGVLSLVVAWSVYRSPTQRTLALALAAMSLLTFCFLTTMHERYAYGAVVFLAFLLSERRVVPLYILFGIIFLFNVFYAIPPPDFRYLAILGSVAMTTLAVSVLSMVLDVARAPTTDIRPSTPPPLEASP